MFYEMRRDVAAEGGWKEIVTAWHHHNFQPLPFLGKEDFELIVWTLDNYEL